MMTFHWVTFLVVYVLCVFLGFLIGYGMNLKRWVFFCDSLRERLAEEVNRRVQAETKLRMGVISDYHALRGAARGYEGKPGLVKLKKRD